MNVTFLFVQPSRLQVNILLIILCAIINIYNLLQDEYGWDVSVHLLRLIMTNN